MPRSRRASALAVAAATLLAVALGGLVTGDAPAQIAAIDEAGWQGVLGVRADVSTAQRYIVVLRGPSLATRVRAEGGAATETQMRKWTSAARAAQEQFLRRVAASGATITAEHRYVRVLNAVSARLDPTSLELLERDREVVAVYPVRVAYPTATDVSPGVPVAVPASVPGLGVPGLEGRGVVVALLDTGVDQSHPFLRESVMSGIDVITPGSGAIAQPHPTIPRRPERHGTELAGVVAGSEGPGGLHGIAPGASILPIRVAGWQPDAEGGYAVYSRTDQVLAGLEAAVDPNEDGDAHDAARIALVGVAEPYASFPDGPLAQAIDGATALDMLVVVPAGNDGDAGPTFGSIAGPGGAPAALTVGAVDGRPASPTVRVYVRASLRVLFDGVLPLGGAPAGTVTAGVVTVPRNVSARGIGGFFDARGASSIAGRAALLTRGGLSDEAVDEAASAGARSILVDGPLPAGAFGLAVPTGVPVVGLPSELASSIRELEAAGIPVTVSIGAVQVAENTGGGSVAAFSSRGLAFGGTPKPELIAPGVAVPTAEPGRTEEGEVRYGTVSGTSVSAAVAAGAAAVLAEARPRAGAVDLRGLLVGSSGAVRDGDASVAGLLDLQGAVQQEVAVEPSVLALPLTSNSPSRIVQTIHVRNLSSRRVPVRIRSAETPAGVEATPLRTQMLIAPGQAQRVRVRFDLEGFEPGQVGEGEVEIVVRGSPVARVPYVFSRPSPNVDLLSQVSLQTTGDRTTDVTPAVVSFVAGAIGDAADPAIRPVGELEVQLWRGGQFRGVLSTRRELLPGHYAFGLTGRGPRGERLPRGNYVVRLVARPEDGTRRQVESVDYPVR
jgi:minor extracellular serine protease Vpr